ncbi:MAG: hypothetical protein R2822_22685 [Spirosomataceae bacterium]
MFQTSTAKETQRRLPINYWKKLQATGATGVKIKVGGRMSNTPENAAQTRRYIPITQNLRRQHYHLC